jgi:hypothetical protein
LKYICMCQEEVISNQGLRVVAEVQSGVLLERPVAPGTSIRRNVFSSA